MNIALKINLTKLTLIIFSLTFNTYAMPALNQDPGTLAAESSLSPGTCKNPCWNKFEVYVCMNISGTDSGPGSCREHCENICNSLQGNINSCTDLCKKQKKEHGPVSIQNLDKSELTRPLY